jgi:hypothetical protein
VQALPSNTRAAFTVVLTRYVRRYMRLQTACGTCPVAMQGHVFQPPAEPPLAHLLRSPNDALHSLSLSQGGQEGIDQTSGYVAFLEVPSPII